MPHKDRDEVLPWITCLPILINQFQVITHLLFNQENLTRYIPRNEKGAPEIT
jgi:hypothetical protein